MFKKIVILAMLINSVFVILYSEENQTKAATTLRIGINTLPTSLNPLYATNETASSLINKIFDSLYCFDANGVIIKSLAVNAHLCAYLDHWEILLQIKRSVFFSDGKELEAEDVVETVKLMNNPAFGYPYVSNTHVIKHIAPVDRFTVKIILAEKIGRWENLFTFKILNAREIKKAKPEFFRQMVLSGTGPYRIQSMGNPLKIVLASNPFFHSTGPRYDYLEYSLMTYTPLAPLKLLNHEIDICELQPEHIAAYKKLSAWQQAFTIYKYKKMGYSFLVFNLRNPILTHNIRNIFYNLLITGDFPTQFLKGRGERVLTPFPTLNENIIPERRPICPLAKKVVIKILINAESKLRREFVVFLAQALKPLNIELKPETMEYISFLEYLKAGHFEVAMSGFVLDSSSDISEFFGSDSLFNYAAFKNPKMDSLIAQGRRETNSEKRAGIRRQAYGIWLEELPLIPLFNLYYHMGVSKKVALPGEVYSTVGANSDFLFNIQQWPARKESKK